MELHVEATGVAHRLSLSIAAPQRGGGGLAVGTGEAYPAGSRLQHRSGYGMNGLATVSRACLPPTWSSWMPVSDCVWGEELDGPQRGSFRVSFSLVPFPGYTKVGWY